MQWEIFKSTFGEDPREIAKTLADLELVSKQWRNIALDLWPFATQKLFTSAQIEFARHRLDVFGKEDTWKNIYRFLISPLNESPVEQQPHSVYRPPSRSFCVPTTPGSSKPVTFTVRESDWYLVNELPIERSWLGGIRAVLFSTPNVFGTQNWIPLLHPGVTVWLREEIQYHIAPLSPFQGDVCFSPI